MIPKGFVCTMENEKILRGLRLGLHLIEELYICHSIKYDIEVVVRASSSICFHFF